MTQKERWTEDDVPGLDGKVALVTGANSGIGWETARILVQHGATVMLGCRNPERAADALERIEALRPAGHAELVALDLADLGSVAAAAADARDRHDRLDLLVNNAGLMATPKGTTAQGFETQFGVNHLGHFALTAALLPALLASPAARVVTISSQGHRMGRINFDDLQAERRYRPWNAYFQSKLANLLFTYELQRRMAAARAPVIAVAAHPGSSSTNISLGEPSTFAQRVMQWMYPLERFVAQPAAMGALPTLRAATDPAVRGGEYYGPHGLTQQHGYPVRVGSTKRSRDTSVAARLWSVSVELTGSDWSALAAARS